MLRMIGNLLAWTMFIGVAGGLVDLVIQMRDKAAKAHNYGVVTMGQLNRAITERPAHNHHKKEHR